MVFDGLTVFTVGVTLPIVLTAAIDPGVGVLERHVSPVYRRPVARRDGFRRQRDAGAPHDAARSVPE